jgi:hypothetical protein
MRKDGKLLGVVHGPVELDSAVAEIVNAVGGDEKTRQIYEKCTREQLSEAAADGDDPTIITVILEYRLRGPGDVTPATVCRRCGCDLRATPDRCPECDMPAAAAAAAAGPAGLSTSD